MKCDLAGIATNKYAKDIGKRYYGGCEVEDVVSKLLLIELKNCLVLNANALQPHSGYKLIQQFSLLALNLVTRFLVLTCLMVDI
jgi:glycine/serine hydroxymethyltransferase